MEYMLLTPEEVAAVERMAVFVGVIEAREGITVDEVAPVVEVITLLTVSMCLARTVILQCKNGRPWAPIMEELLFYKCENAQVVGAIAMDVAEGEVTDVVETNGLSVLLAQRNTYRKMRALSTITLWVIEAGETDAALAMAHMEEVIADSLGH
jgi:hypothetical protein